MYILFGSLPQVSRPSPGIYFLDLCRRYHGPAQEYTFLIFAAGITALLKKMDYHDVVVAIDGSVFR
jgi:hypothetical protein